MKSVACLALLLLTGCAAYHPQPVNVYGASGKPYTAPDLCAAVTQCLQTEAKCYYNTTVMQTTTGQTEQTACKVQSK